MRARPSLSVLGIQRKLGNSIAAISTALLLSGCLTPDLDEHRDKKEPAPLDRYGDVPPLGIDVRPANALSVSPVWIVLGSLEDCGAATAALTSRAHVVCADARVTDVDLEPALRAGLRKLKKEVTNRVTSDPVTVYAAPSSLARGRAIVSSAPGFFARAVLWVPPAGLGTLGSTLLEHLGSSGGKSVVLLGVDGEALEPLVRSARRAGLALHFFPDAPQDPERLFAALRDRYGTSALGGAPAPGPSGAPPAPRPAP